MATLSGYSKPAMAAPMWDHTYASTDDGKSWCCFGSDNGGKQVCSDSGDSAFADCLSAPMYHECSATIAVSRFAGILYGVHGVCHQAANRVLYPAGILVTKARGYGFSLLAYGTYGNHSPTWPELQKCATIHSGSGGVGGNIGGGSGGHLGGLAMQGDNKTAQFSRKIRSIYAQIFQPFIGGSSVGVAEVAEQELSALAEMNLGEGYDRGKISQVAKIQRHFRDVQSQLARDVEVNKLTPNDYSNQLKYLLSETASACERVLGSADYLRLFGVPPSAAAHLVNSSR
jgi:hypothetical protein